ncbi:sentrin-specific protease [Moesziomyces aphidis]|uniref:Sentrin-specific protease n=1 Tax=Moesziomyces aphidis TaxID=84754 RepID=W3VGE7_MOEAP|nr:sentrin-specific protease [Moesziomyces aphidis]
MPFYHRQNGSSFNLSAVASGDCELEVLFEIAEDSKAPADARNFASILIDEVISSSKLQLEAGAQLLRLAMEQDGRQIQINELAADVVGWGERLLAGEALADHSRRVEAWRKTRKDLRGKRPRFKRPPSIETAGALTPGLQHFLDLVQVPIERLAAMYAGPKRSESTLRRLDELCALDELPAPEQPADQVIPDDDLDDLLIRQSKFILDLLTRFHLTQGPISRYRKSKTEYHLPAGNGNVAVIHLTLVDSSTNCEPPEDVLLDMATHPTCWCIKKLDHECFMSQGHVCFRHVSGAHTFGFVRTLQPATNTPTSEALIVKPDAIHGNASPLLLPAPQQAKAPHGSDDSTIMLANVEVDLTSLTQSSEGFRGTPQLSDLQLHTVILALSQLESCPSWSIGERSIASSEVQTLLPGKWLSDGVLNPYFELIEDHVNRTLLQDGRAPRVKVYPTYFLRIWDSANRTDSRAIRGFTKRRDTYKPAGDDQIVNILDLELAIFPFHLQGNHWSFLLVSVRHRRYVYFDSIRNRSKAAMDEVQRNLDAIKEYLNQEVKARGQRDVNFDWEFHEDETFPRQVGGNDCAVFLAQGAKEACLQQPTRRWKDVQWSFSQEDVPHLRATMARELANQKLEA